MIKTIKIRKEDMAIIDQFGKDSAEAKMGYQEACSLLKVAHDKLWETLHDLYPEVKDGKPVLMSENKEWKLIYFHKEEETNP